MARVLEIIAHGMAFGLVVTALGIMGWCTVVLVKAKAWSGAALTSGIFLLLVFTGWGLIMLTFP